MIKKGNLLDTKFQVIAHQVNCQGVMGAGVARAIKSKYPEVFAEYAELCEDSDESEISLLGCCQISSTSDGKFVANLFGQDSYGTNAKQTNYKKLHNALMSLREQMEESDLATVSFPYMIGCGLAGGDISVVKSLIEDVFDDSNIVYNFYDIN